MNNVINISIADGKVNARELHNELKVDTRFNDWIARRIEEYGFEEGIDFYSELSKTQGRPAVEYKITLGMAKELAMLEKNETGRKIRKYFIKCEENLIDAVKQNMVPKEMYLEAAAELKDIEEANELLTNNYNDIRLMRMNTTNEVAEYVEEQLVYSEKGKVMCAKLYSNYQTWCSNQHHYTPYSVQQFQELVYYCLVQGHPIVKQGNYYIGIEVRK